MKLVSGKMMIVVTILVAILTGCTVIRQGEVGVKRRLGKLDPKTIQPGAKVFFPFTTRIIKVPIRTQNVELRLDLPSKEGVNVSTSVSILYHIKPEMASKIIETIGPDYESVMILSVFRSKAADATARYDAKDMYSSARATIEKEIADSMNSVLNARGFEIEQVLLKSIQLPPGLAQAIEQKLKAEQEAQQMQFVLQRERLEAERKRIEAEGVRDAQQIVGQGLNDTTLQWLQIQALRELSQSPNAKVILMNGPAQQIMIQADPK